MARMIGARLVAGWTIAYPTLGNGHMYVATSAVRPGIVKRFRNLGDAQAWCIRNDVTDEAMAQAWAARSMA